MNLILKGQVESWMGFSRGEGGPDRVVQEEQPTHQMVKSVISYPSSYASATSTIAFSRFYCVLVPSRFYLVVLMLQFAFAVCKNRLEQI